jgi:capsular polysaccharide biosynthesis protein
VAAGDVYRALWRHKYLILALTAACVLATWYATSQQTKTYEASTLVRVQQRSGDPGNALSALQASQQLAETYARIIGSGALDGRVEGRVRSLLSGSKLGPVDISGEPVEDLDLLWLTARDESPTIAALVANTLPRVLQNFTASTGSTREQIVIVKRATRPEDPASPNMSLNIALALVLALIFNGALVLLYEVLRDRLPDTEELDELTGLPVLATIPQLRLRELRTVVSGSDGNRPRQPDARPRTEAGARSGGEA